MGCSGTAVSWQTVPLPDRSAEPQFWLVLLMETSLTGGDPWTEIVTVAVDCSAPSYAAYVKTSSPVKSESEVYSNEPSACRLRLPLLTSLTSTAVNGATFPSSLSLASTPGAGTTSVTAVVALNASPFATGGVLIPPLSQSGGALLFGPHTARNRRRIRHPQTPAPALHGRVADNRTGIGIADRDRQITGSGTGDDQDIAAAIPACAVDAEIR